MKIGIRSIATSLPKLSAVYGFGSAFRSATYNDVDLLAIFDSSDPETFLQYLAFINAVAAFAKKLHIRIDTTALTETEALAKPLNESDKLVELYVRQVKAREAD